jgi:hypothetical protein
VEVVVEKVVESKMMVVIEKSEETARTVLPDTALAKVESTAVAESPPWLERGNSFLFPKILT